MKSQTEVVVIGGGIAGCSTLYHLTQEGITDCVLLERDELTSGTTWHSAAQVTNFGPNQTMVGLKTHSIKLYKELADDPEHPINYHHGTGGLRLATEQWHMDGYHHFASMAAGMGVEYEILDAEETKRRHPLISTDGLLGALWDPLDGDIDPAQLCQALVRRARKAGAEVERFTDVTGLEQQPDSSWIVRTNKGDIHANKIVNAGGYRCNEIGAMMGVEHPVASMEHQYMLTEPLPEIEALGNDFRVPLIRCPNDDFYSRAEKQGLLIGFYEQDCKTWGLDGISPDFTMALCPDDLDRVADVMMGAIGRIPALERAGIHTVINGPITYTPDGLPLVGKVPSKRNAYCITGLRAGLGEGGGHGWLLAQIIAHGEAVYDTWCLDPRRFGDHATQEYTALKAIEDYQNEFRFHRPHEHRPAGRDLRHSPIFAALEGLGAEFAPLGGTGWERADYYKPEGFEEQPSFYFTDAEDLVRSEIANLTENCGIADVCGFTRLQLSGEGVHDWLEGIVCSRVPRKIGKVGLAYFLNSQGDIKGEATLVTRPDGSVWWGAAAAARQHDIDWLTERLPADGSIRLDDLTETHLTLVVAGPKIRSLLAKVSPRTDWQAFKALTAQTVNLGPLPAYAMAVSFSGEDAFELHISTASAPLIFDLLWETGEEFGLGPFGMRAIESMRLEMGYRHWKADLITEFNPAESDLMRFVRPDLRASISSTLRRKFVTMEIDNEDAPAHPGDSVMSGGKVVGTITSAAFGHRTEKNLAMAFVDVDCPDSPTVRYLGKEFSASIIPHQPFQRG